MGGSWRRARIPALAFYVLGGFRPSLAAGAETLAFGASRCLAAHRDAIRQDIFTNFWDDELQSFVQSKGTKDLDASVLLMPLMRFISPVDPMWRSTMKAIEARLVEDTF